MNVKIIMNLTTYIVIGNYYLNFTASQIHINIV